MKVHIINILLFHLPLNILENTHNKTHTTPSHTTKIPTTRLLCECELYAPANYDNDLEMKRVMQQFEDRTSQRFEEYDERIKTTRQKYKEQCDKEMQKIILKDKLEKQMAEKLTTLETKITTDDIPTCGCEKSLADKVEKGCLRCAQNLGGIVAPSTGVLSGIGEAAISMLQPLAITAAENAAKDAATALATQAGIDAVKFEIKQLLTHFTQKELLFDLKLIVKETTFDNGPALFQSAEELANGTCIVEGKEIGGNTFCSTILRGKDTTFGPYAKAGATAYETELASQTTTLTEAKVGAVNATYAGYHASIIASIVAIVVIVLIMVIIYKILRYKRKKKMKKKLQYIKLLEE
ncbi:rifin PIR protein, putative [Plasmodium reichenowi]|uniref:Rifin PIR protein, putative n=1 Tax=Plasmodium reichenowi TaxID=5854 RepID=A0A2P9D1B8_PLARE|nr:rifin PIR protein, putative [Plasmodium reichenowi]SOV84069.1 rifin PIR protein, putative [Plasmodium reichenowi]